MIRRLAILAFALGSQALAVVPEPVADPNVGITPSGGASIASVSAKGSFGNMYGINAVSGGVITSIIAYDSPTMPADGSLNAALVRYCVTLAANGGSISDNFRDAPYAFVNGVQLFASSAGCAVKTSVTVSFLAAQVK